MAGNRHRGVRFWECCVRKWLRSSLVRRITRCGVDQSRTGNIRVGSGEWGMGSQRKDSFPYISEEPSCRSRRPERIKSAPRNVRQAASLSRLSQLATARSLDKLAACRTFSTGALMFCPGCGFQVNDDLKFCRQCGANLRGVREAMTSRPTRGKFDWSKTWRAEMIYRKEELERKRGVTPG